MRASSLECGRVFVDLLCVCRLLVAGAVSPTAQILPPGNAAQPRSSEKNAARRAEKTLCARWAVGVCYTRAKRSESVAKGSLCVLITSCAGTF